MIGFGDTHRVNDLCTCTCSCIARRCLAYRAQRGPLGVLSRRQDCISLALRARPTVYGRGVLSEFRAARTCASYWFDNGIPGSFKNCLVGLQPTVIASRASPPLLEQSSSIQRFKESWTRVARQELPGFVKPARLHSARTARALTGRYSEATCPNF